MKSNTDNWKKEDFIALVNLNLTKALQLFVIMFFCYNHLLLQLLTDTDNII